jgi:peptidoglycan/xylan/chitin deacetylase (PgdA/CDA1 family)
LSAARSAKRAFERAIIWTGIPRRARRRLAGRTIVIAYHNVVEDRAPLQGDSSLHIPLRAFCRHLDVLQQLCDVVDLRALGEPPCGPRPRAAITFDDAYRGTLRLGLAELARRSLPSTVFVPPAFVPDGTFWWDALARERGLSAEDRGVALGAARGRDAAVRARFGLPAAGAEWPRDLRCASLDELHTAVRLGPVTLGSHTWSHPNLSRCTPDELCAEMSRPRAWLREEFPESAIPAISYPYGLETPDVRAAAAAAGYSMGFRVDGGWIPDGPVDPLGLPRLNVPAGLSLDGLALRLSGIFS